MKEEPKYVTKKTLEEVLDRRFAEFEKRLTTQFAAQFEVQFEVQFAILFGKLNVYFDKRFSEMEERLDKRYAPTLTIADSTQKRMDDVEHESLALGAQVDRHEVWIHRVSDTAARSI